MKNCFNTGGPFSDGMKLVALMAATEDQLRVMGWDLADPSDRFLAISEAKQRRLHPELARKAEADGGLEGKDYQTWIAPLQEMQGGRLRGPSLTRSTEKYSGPEAAGNHDHKTSKVEGSLKHPFWPLETKS